MNYLSCFEAIADIRHPKANTASAPKMRWMFYTCYLLSHAARNYKINVILYYNCYFLSYAGITRNSKLVSSI